MRRKKEEEGGNPNLTVRIPTFFRCPISLDVKKSPVSLCMGVTYDRSPIQRWLDSGNNTCPATMQPLPSTDLVPNLTLQCLINLWGGGGQEQEAAAAAIPARALIREHRSCSISSLILVLKQGRSVESRANAAAIIDTLLSNFAESKVGILEKNKDLIPELIRLLEVKSSKRAIESGLSCLIVLATIKRERIKMVRLGIVAVVTRILKEDAAGVAVSEKAMRQMEAASGCRREGGDLRGSKGDDTSGDGEDDEGREGRERGGGGGGVERERDWDRKREREREREIRKRTRERLGRERERDWDLGIGRIKSV